MGYRIAIDTGGTFTSLIGQGAHHVRQRAKDA